MPTRGAYSLYPSTVPIVNMAGSVHHLQDYLSWISYALPLLHSLNKLKAIQVTHEAQDRLLATILSRVDQL